MMQKLTSLVAMLVILGFTSCSDEADKLKNDESYFVGDWNVSSGRYFVVTGQSDLGGYGVVYKFKNGGDFMMSSLLSIENVSEGPTTPTPTTIGQMPYGKWSYLEASKQLQIFTNQKEVYDVIQTDRDNFVAVGGANGMRLQFSRQ